MVPEKPPTSSLRKKNPQQASKHDVDLALIDAGRAKHVAWNQTLKIIGWLLAGAGGGLALQILEKVLRR